MRRLLVRVCIVCAILLVVYTLKPLVVAAADPLYGVNLFDYSSKGSGYGCFGKVNAITTSNWDGTSQWLRTAEGSPAGPSCGCADHAFYAKSAGTYWLEWIFNDPNSYSPVGVGLHQDFTVTGYLYRPTSTTCNLHCGVLFQVDESWAASPTYTPNVWVPFTWSFRVEAGERLRDFAASCSANVLLDHLSIVRTDPAPIYWPGFQITAMGTREPTSWWTHLWTGNHWQARLQVQSLPAANNYPRVPVLFYAESVLPLGGVGDGADSRPFTVGYAPPGSLEACWESWQSGYSYNTEDLGWEITVYLPTKSGALESLTFAGLWDDIKIQSRDAAWALPTEPPVPTATSDVQPPDPTSAQEGFFQWLFSPSEASIAKWGLLMEDLSGRVPISLFHDAATAISTMYAALPSGADWTFDLSSGPAFPLVVTLDYDSSVAVVIRGISTALIVGSFMGYCVGLYSRFFHETKK
jgi:hypothetical protein